MGDQTRILLVRHAHHDSDGRFTQHSCPGLSDVGRREARVLAESLARSDLGLDPVVLPSRAQRCAQTGGDRRRAARRPTVRRHVRAVRDAPWRRGGLTFEEMRQQFGPNYGFVPGAEYFPDWMPQAVERLRSVHSRHHGRTVIGVTHFTVVKAALVAFSQWTNADLDLVAPGNTAIAEWVSEPLDGAGALTLRRLTDVSHL